MRGYSLLELLVVLAIIGLLVSVATPVVSTSLDRVTLTADVRAVATRLRTLRDEALDQQKEITLDAAALPLTAGTAIEVGPANRALIGADGASTARLTLTRGATSMTVSVNRLTGRITIEPAP